MPSPTSQPDPSQPGSNLELPPDLAAAIKRTHGHVPAFTPGFDDRVLNEARQALRAGRAQARFRSRLMLAGSAMAATLAVVAGVVMFQSSGHPPVASQQRADGPLAMEKPKADQPLPSLASGSARDTLAKAETSQQFASATPAPAAPGAAGGAARSASMAMADAAVPRPRLRDIVDALHLAQKLRDGQRIDLSWDVNADGVVNLADVDAIAVAAVRLPDAALPAGNQRGGAGPSQHANPAGGTSGGAM